LQSAAPPLLPLRSAMASTSSNGGELRGDLELAQNAAIVVSREALMAFKAGGQALLRADGGLTAAGEELVALQAAMLRPLANSDADARPLAASVVLLSLLVETLSAPEERLLLHAQSALPAVVALVSVDAGADAVALPLLTVLQAALRPALVRPLLAVPNLIPRLLGLMHPSCCHVNAKAAAQVLAMLADRSHGGRQKPAAAAGLCHWGAAAVATDLLAAIDAGSTLAEKDRLAATVALLRLLEGVVATGERGCAAAGAAGAIPRVVAVIAREPLGADADDAMNIALCIALVLATGSRDRAEWLSAAGCLPAAVRALGHADAAVATNSAALIGELVKAVAPMGGPATAAPHPLARRLLDAGAGPALAALLKPPNLLLLMPNAGASAPEYCTLTVLIALASAGAGMPRRLALAPQLLPALAALIHPPPAYVSAIDVHEPAARLLGLLASGLAVADGGDAGGDDALAEALAAAAVVPRLVRLLELPGERANPVLVHVLTALGVLAGCYRFGTRFSRDAEAAGAAALLQALMIRRTASTDVRQCSEYVLRVLKSRRGQQQE